MCHSSKKPILLLLVVLLNIFDSKLFAQTSSIDIQFRILKVGQFDSTEFSFTNHHTSSIKLIKKTINSSYTIKYPKKLKVEPGQTVKLKCYIKRNSVGLFIDSSKSISYTLGSSSKKVKLIVKALVPKKIESNFNYQSDFNVHDSIVFDSIQHDFGKVKEGEQVAHFYYFRNYSSKPLIIMGAPTNCGCVTPSYNPEPVLPCSTGLIKIVFNTSGKIGLNQKTVTVNTNLGFVNLTLKCEVIPR